MIKASDIASLREKTELGMMECKKALEEAKGDESQALEILRRKGASKAASKAEREVKSGIIEAYVHDSKIGVLLEVLTETDFVAKNEEFKQFVHDVALHIAASEPKYIESKEIPADLIEKEKDILLSQDDLKGKPKEIAEKIINGRMNKFYEQVCLLNQTFIKDQDKTIEDLLNSLIQKIGEKIVISRFVRYQIGE